MKFYNVYHDIKNNVKLALMSLWTPGNHPMRQYIDELLSRESETVLQPPVFQSTFPWRGTDNDDWRNCLIPLLKKLNIFLLEGSAMIINIFCTIHITIALFFSQKYKLVIF